jgi:hypothetical protein
VNKGKITAVGGRRTAHKRLAGLWSRLGRLVRAGLDWLLLEGSEVNTGNAFEDYVQQMDQVGLRDIDADAVWQDLNLDQSEQKKA